MTYNYRDVGVREELQLYLRRWTQRQYADFPILYLALHGQPGRILLGPGSSASNELDLDWFEEELHGKCHGRVIHFGSCGTLDQHGHPLNRFMKQTGVKAITGYREDVD